MRSMLDAAEFHGASIDMKDAMELIRSAKDIIGRAEALAEG